MALNKLGVAIEVQDKASNKLRAINGQFLPLTKSVKRARAAAKNASGGMLKGMVAVAIGAKAMGAAMGAAMDAGAFEQDLGRVKLIMSATGDEMDALRAKAVDAGMITQFSPQEALSGLKQLGTLGFTAAESMEALTGTLDFAAGANLSVAQASATTGSALRVFSLDADQATITADKLMKITTLTALQANDLELALGGVSRGAGAANQSMETMLVSMGLVKNTGVDASVAASSVSAALVFMAKNRDKFDKMGISLVDAKGDFRDFNAIVLETQGKMADIHDADERLALGQSLFGRFGLSAFNAISRQLSVGIRTSNGDLLKGAEAVKFLTDELKNAKGTAEAFREATLNTLPGQLTLIRGLWETFKLEMGTAAAAILKPLVMLIKEGVIKLIKWFKALSPTMRKVLSVAGLVTGAMITLGGAVALVMSAIVLIGPQVLAAGAAFVSMLGPVLLIVAAVAALAAGFLVLKEAYDRNIGGFASTVDTLFTKVKLLFVGMYQLITEGFLSGDIAKKLKDPKHSGILQFLVILFKWGHRAKIFVEEVGKSFGDFLGRMREPFNQLAEAFEKAQEAIAGIVGDLDGLTAGMDGVRSSGSALGNIIGGAFWLIVTAVTIALSVFSGFVQKMRQIRNMVAPVMDLGGSFDSLKEALTELGEALGFLDGSAGTSSDFFEEYGAAIGFVTATFVIPAVAAFKGMIGVITHVVNIVTGAVKIIRAEIENVEEFFAGFMDFLSGDFEGGMERMGAAIGNIWDSMFSAISGVVDSMIDVLQGMMDFIADSIMAIPERFRPDFLTDTAVSLRGATGGGSQSEGPIDMGMGEFEAKQDRARQFEGLGFTNIPFANNTGSPEEKAKKADGITKEDLKEVFGALFGGGPPKVAVQVKVGDEDVAAAVERAARTENSLSFGDDSGSEDG